MIRKALHRYGSTQFIKNFVCAAFASETKRYSSVVPSFRLATNWPDRIAITDEFGDYSYGNLFIRSKELASQLTEIFGGKTQERIALLCPNNATYVLSQWACWISGQIAVPLCTSHPQEMWEYFIKDSGCSIMLGTEEYNDKISLLSEKTGIRSLIVSSQLRNSAMINEKLQIETSASNLKGGCNPNLYTKWNALIIYTSGSTALPKGVILSFANLSSQINGMISAWNWSAKDTILHALPLHHVHGLVNGLLTPLHCGARCLLLPKFNPAEVWNNLLSVKVSTSRRVTVFTGVPTMYVQLIKEYENSLNKTERIVNYVKATCSQKVRLMMCGSAPLPETVFYTWEQITGHQLLERYGMSETGMILSNPLNGHRKPGFVGNPLPNVIVRLVDNNKVILEGNEYSSKIISKDSKTKSKNKIIGELHVKGENVFKEYWGRPEVTKQSFTEEGWFITGDIVEYVDNCYRILGRSSVDIIKSGGYKISALFIEAVLIQHPNIVDVAVLGLQDLTWGQKVAAVIVPKENAEDRRTALVPIKSWVKQKLPTYMIPMTWKIVSEIPRNTMGKVNKKELNILFSEKKL